MDNVSNPMLTVKFNSQFKIFQKENSSLSGFTGEFYQKCKEEIVSVLHTVFPKTEGTEHFPTHSV